MHKIFLPALLLIAANLPASCLAGERQNAQKQSPKAEGASPVLVVFHNVRVFDGKRLLSQPQTVIIKDGKIVAVGPVASVRIPAEAKTQIEGGGSATLLPGLIDAHTHVYGNALAEALIFGVTTEFDMFTDYRMAAAMRAQQSQGTDGGRADLFSAGTLVTAPGGHGTEYGFPIPTITRPDEAQNFVDTRIAEGSDYIKIILDDGSTYGGHIPTLDAATIKAVVVAAHKRGKLAVAHIGSYADAKEVIEAGADGLAHLFVDRAPDPDFGKLLASHHAFVIPTLSVLQSISGGSQAAKEANTLEQVWKRV